MKVMGQLDRWLTNDVAPSVASRLFTAFRICVEVTAQTFPEVPVIGVDHSCTPV